jgi:hypothetical protein
VTHPDQPHADQPHADQPRGRTRPTTRVRAAKFERRYAPAVVDDLTALGSVDPGLVDAALAAVEDLAFGRQRGKLLGQRHVSGDLTGLARLRFDRPGQHPSRYRIVFRVIDDDDANDRGQLPMIEVLAIGERADHVVYRDTLARLDPTGDNPATDDTPDDRAGE